MDHNGVVTSPALHLVDLLHHSDDGLWVGALALRVPVLDVELGHLVLNFAGLNAVTVPCFKSSSTSNMKATNLKSDLQNPLNIASVLYLILQCH